MAEKSEIVKDAKGNHKDLVLMEEAPVVQEVAAPEPEPEIQAQPESIEQEVSSSHEPEYQPVKETRNASNFRQLKAEMARIAKERDEKNVLIAQYEAEKKSRQIQKVEEPEEDSEDFDTVSIKKNYKKLLADLEAVKRETQEVKVLNGLRQKYQDYDRVMSDENIRAFETLKPTMARSINMADPYAARETVYELIKQYGIDQDETDKTELTKALIKQNQAKPKPGVAIQGTKATSQSPLGRASEFYEGPLTDEMKKVFYKEMQDAMNKGR